MDSTTHQRGITANVSGGQSEPAPTPAACSSNKPKPCCVCIPEKEARDNCMLIKGSQEDCQNVIQSYRSCMKGYGFNV